MAVSLPPLRIYNSTETATDTDIQITRPILTPKTVLPIFFVVGIIFAPLGGLLLWASSMVHSQSLSPARLQG